MKKKCVIIVLTAILLAALAWRMAYSLAKHTDNIPSMDCIARMDDAEIHSKLEGYRVEQLMEVWGKPRISDEAHPVWIIDEHTSLMVGLKLNGVAVSFHIIETDKID